MNVNREFIKILFKILTFLQNLFEVYDVITAVYNTDVHQRYQTLRHLDPGMGLNLEVFGVFP